MLRVGTVALPSTNYLCLSRDRSGENYDLILTTKSQLSLIRKRKQDVSGKPDCIFVFPRQKKALRYIGILNTNHA